MILPQDIEWRKALQSEFEKPYFEELVSFLDEERKRGITIYPPESQIYRALDLCPPEKVKAVILGQDPYHGEGQACGLSFSVPIGVKAPPSLKNIFKELSSDLGVLTSGSTDLEPWARQGVLLLNSILTVRAHEPASHSKIGWDKFTDAIISYLSEHYSGIVFMLIMLSSLAGMKSGRIPVTLLLVAVLYLGQEVYSIFFVQDNVANFMHLVGGACGTAFGFAAVRRRKG